MLVVSSSFSHGIVKEVGTPMTLDEKQKAIELREAGKSYKEIADILGVAKSTISTLFQRRKPEGKRCQCCGSRIKNANTGRKKFCSDKCRKSWWKSNGNHHKSQETICENCGNKFINHESKERRFCSFSCYQAFRKGGGSR